MLKSENQILHIHIVILLQIYRSAAVRLLINSIGKGISIPLSKIP